ncbi:hypothetical protein [Collinsella ihumii]|uniref:hypothetical protein n=1 Tax=Collinsella ihumii TaxID=1720204 RepID=UPI0025AB432A|nr:hypothetical protein [Collinsella ihumii]MDN0055790.1 hypothetical protein [Collinsella ihumii]
MELVRMVRSPWFVGSVAVLGFLVIVSALLNQASYSEWYGYAQQYQTKNYGMENRVMVNAWVGTDRRPSSALLYFLLPLLCLLPGAGTLIEERASGYQAHALSRMSDGLYYGAKALACFVAAGLVALMPLCLSLVASAMVMPYGLPDLMAYATLSASISNLTPFQYLFYTFPIGYLGTWCVMTCCLCGLWATTVLACSLFARSPVRLFAGACIFQILLNYASVNLSKVLSAELVNAVDLFTLLVPTGYEGSIPTSQTLGASLVAYAAASLIIPILFFRRRCYL